MGKNKDEWKIRGNKRRNKRALDAVISIAMEINTFRPVLKEVFGFESCIFFLEMLCS